MDLRVGDLTVCPLCATSFACSHRECAATACAEDGGGDGLYCPGCRASSSEPAWMAAMQSLHAHSSISWGLPF